MVFSFHYGSNFLLDATAKTRIDAELEVSKHVFIISVLRNKGIDTTKAFSKRVVFNGFIQLEKKTPRTVSLLMYIPVKGTNLVYDATVKSWP